MITTITNNTLFIFWYWSSDSHSLVPLKFTGAEGSTYINANFIRVSMLMQCREILLGIRVGIDRGRLFVKNLTQTH